MLKTVTGIFRHGKVQLIEVPVGVPEDSRVIVTFLDEQSVSLIEHGIDEAQAYNLRSRLASFAEEWNSPDMAIYDDAKRGH